MQASVTGRTQEPGWKLWARGIGRIAYLGLLFICAGRADWTRGWILAGLIVGSSALNFALMRWKNPSLIRARLEEHDNVEPFDRKFFAVSVPLGFLFLIVTGLDERFGWSRLEGDWLFVGLLLHAAGTLPIALASVYNPFMELAVRIQDERGQTPVTAGPYRFVRHPMYVGLILMFLAWPLVSGSLWSYMPLGSLVAAYVVRTALEDRTLRKELRGLRRIQPAHTLPAVSRSLVNQGGN